MKTSKVLQTIDVMTESVVKELNEMSEKIDGKANHSYVQTIAKHLINLETRVTDLEKEKCNCKTKIAEPNVKEVCKPSDDSILEKFLKDNRTSGNSKLKVYNINGSWCLDYNSIIEIEKNRKQTDYFQKAKTLLIEYAEKTMIKKGMEYTPIGDRFANFRPILGEKKTAIEKLIGYNAKHVQYCFMQENNMAAKTIDELLEHWGDVFNYNVLGLAMENTDRSKAFVVPYADRPTQEKEIKNIVDSAKNFTEFDSKLSGDELYDRLLHYIKESNLNYIIFLFAKQLERLENSK